MREVQTTPGILRAAVVFMALLALCALPLFAAHQIPLIDYPFHLARMHILHSHPSDGFLQKVYEVSFAPLPNLGMDVIVITLSKVLPVEAASRLFIFLSMATTLSGVGALHRVVHGEWSGLNMLLGAVLLYNWIFVFGFVNYLFGIGLLLWSLAIWSAMLDWPTWSRILVGAALSLLLFFAHLVAFVLFAIALGGVGLHRSLDGWRLNVGRLFNEALTALAACALPAAFYLFLSPSSEDLAGGFIFQSLPLKLKSLILTPLSANPAGDAVVGLAVGLLGVYGLWRGKISIASSMRLVLLLFTIVFFVAPVGSTAGWHLDDRIPLVFLLLLAATLRIRLPTGRNTFIVVAILIAALGTRMLVTTFDWVVWDRLYERTREAFSTLEAPAVVYVAARNRPESRNSLVSYYQSVRPPLRHIGSYAALERGMFVPMVYAHPHLQPIRIAEPMLELSEIQGTDPLPVNSDAELAQLIEDLRSVTSGASTSIEHVYLYVHGSPWSAGTLPDAAIAISDPHFTIIRIR